MKYDNEQLIDKSACAGVRADLKMCLLESDCCRIVSYKTLDIYSLLEFIPHNNLLNKNKKTPRECLNMNDGSVPNECQVLRNTFFECKRSIVS